MVAIFTAVTRDRWSLVGHQTTYLHTYVHNMVYTVQYSERMSEMAPRTQTSRGVGYGH